MKLLFSQLLSALQRGENAVLCHILASSGSTPRGAGAKMAVFADGHSLGTIGGGAVEQHALSQAQAVLQCGRSTLRGFSLTPHQVSDIGMICGGSVTVYFQFFSAENAEDLAFLQGVNELLCGEESAWLIMALQDDCVISCGTYDALHGIRFARQIPLSVIRPYCSSRANLQQGAVSYYTEPLVQAGQVVLFGGGHIGSALVPLLADCGFRVTVYDDRPDFALSEHYPAAQRVIQGSYTDVFSQLSLTADDYAVIMTPGHQADREVLLQVLRTPATYIGCIGSRHKIALTNQYLLQHGILEAELSRIHSPIGLEIYAETPAEIAVSVAAELIRHRALRSGADRKPPKSAPPEERSPSR